MNRELEIEYDEYFYWLVDLITGPSKADQRRSEEFYGLFAQLYSIEFYSDIPRDDNRAADGTELRYFYCESTDTDPVPGENIPEGECSFFEMIVGLAFRMERDILHVDELGDRTSKWFWMILENLGLDNRSFTDDFLAIDSTKTREIDEIIETVMNRTYDRKGEGGLFPLIHPKKDQRKVEIWYQMSDYIQENGYV